ncbi:MAG: hypothetical protein LBR85_06550 [Oscillospiraceae bacterium]|jgi:hypothetical protein|nr:hypothetical protein [Oscillospiraceae bacterium]
MRKILAKAVALALTVSAFAVTATPAQAEPTLKDGFTLLGSGLLTGEAATVAETLTVELVKGQSLYIFADAVGSDGSLSTASTGGGIVLMLASNANYSLNFDFSTSPAVKEQGKGGFRYVYSYAPVGKESSEGIVADMDAYFSTIADNIADMVYDPLGPAGFIDVLQVGGAWRPENDAHNQYCGNLVQYYNWMQPDVMTLEDGVKYTMRPGYQIVAPETADYTIGLWAAGNGAAGVSSSIFLLSGPAPAPGEVTDDPPASEAPSATPSEAPTVTDGGSEPVITDGYTVLKSAETTAGGIQVFNREKFNFRKGQSVYFLTDFADATGSLNLTNEGAAQAVWVGNTQDEENSFYFDLVTPNNGYVMPTEQGGQRINFIYTYAPVKGVINGRIEDLDAYYSNLMDNIGYLAYDVAGPYGLGGMFGPGWRAEKDEHNQYAGILGQLGGWFMPDLIDEQTVIRPGIRVDITADGEYEVIWWNYNPNAGVKSTVLMVVGDTPEGVVAAPPGQTSAEPASPTPPPTPAPTDTPTTAPPAESPAPNGGGTGGGTWIIVLIVAAALAAGCGCFFFIRARKKK